MRGKKKRVLAILVVLIMTFALIPAQTAWAEYKNDDVCPNCNEPALLVMYDTADMHSIECPICLWGTTGDEPLLPVLFENHYGGTATCKSRAVCIGCEHEYGDLNLDNHVNIVEDKAVAATCTEAGKTAGKHCDDCGKVIEEQTEVKALGHSWGAWTVTKEATTSEEGVETRVCKNDSSHTETRKIAKKEETKKEETKKEETKKEAAKAETVSKTTDTQPQTGDENQTVWVIMMMLSAAILIVLAIRKRRVFD